MVSILVATLWRLTAFVLIRYQADGPGLCDCDIAQGCADTCGGLHRRPDGEASGCPLNAANNTTWQDVRDGAPVAILRRHAA